MTKGTESSKPILLTVELHLPKPLDLTNPEDPNWKADHGLLHNPKSTHHQQPPNHLSDLPRTAIPWAAVTPLTESVGMGCRVGQGTAVHLQLPDAPQQECLWLAASSSKGTCSISGSLTSKRSITR